MLKIFRSNSKHTKRRDGNILRLVLPSLLSVALCLACLAGTTWAWFTSTVSGNVATLNAARFSFTIEVQQMDVSVEPHVPVGDPLTQRAYRDGDEDVPAIFEFDYNSSYLVTITPDEEQLAEMNAVQERQRAEMAEERERLEAERAETKKVMEQLQQLKSEMSGYKAEGKPSAGTEIHQDADGG